MKPNASLSLDLDNLWVYLKTHGDSGWESFPSYLEVVVPRALEFLRDRSLRITFFVVGQDASLEKNREAIASLSAAGHEIGNHSFSHEPWLHLYSEERIESELSRTEDHIQSVTGIRPVGFRGPGFSLSETVLRALQRRGYEYDATTFPTFIGPLARAYYFRTARLSKDEKEKRRLLFGRLAEGLRPNKPYRWDLGDERLLEIPVTTFPILKIPIHVSYLHYLTEFSPLLARLYFRAALFFCRLVGVEPSLLLHPLDFMGAEDAREFAFFPGMGLTRSLKIAQVGAYLDEMERRFNLLTMREHAARIASEGSLPVRIPHFHKAAPAGEVE